MYGYGYPVVSLGVSGTGLNPPVNTVAPAITGTAEVGQTLTCSTGTWSNAPTSYAYQWKRGGVNIGGATSSTYTLVSADAGESIKCTVTATNGAGSASADSNTVSVLFNKYSMTFDGVDEAITTGNFDITSEISVSLWMKTTDTDTLNTIIAKDTTSSRSWHILWRGSNAGLRKLYWWVWNTNGAANYIESTANILDDGQWHHVLCTYDGTANTNGMKLYIDGVLDKQGTTSSTGIKANPSVTVTMGRLSNVNDWYFAGSLDEVAIWNTDQSANISTIYNSGDPASLSSLSPNHWWRMGDGDTFSTNWTLVDNGSGGVNGTSVNMESGDRTTNVP